jgi:hypothetical protein
VLKLGEDLLDWVEVGGVFRQEEKLGAGCPNELAHGSALVAAEVVHDDDFAGLQGRDEDLLDINSKGLAVDRAVENPWGANPTVAQGSQKGRRLPVAVRDFGREPCAAGRMVLLLAVVLLLMPVPLSNVAPAMVISLISLAYVEEDGLLLSAAFLAAIILIGIGSAAVWGTIVGVALISSQ